MAHLAHLMHKTSQTVREENEKGNSGRAIGTGMLGTGMLLTAFNPFLGIPLAILGGLTAVCSPDRSQATN
jgi:hypothetical protein